MTLDTESLVHTHPNRMTLLNVNIDTSWSLSLISQASLPLKSWDEAFFRTMINRLPTHVLPGEVFLVFLSLTILQCVPCLIKTTNSLSNLSPLLSLDATILIRYKCLSRDGHLYISLSCYFFMNHPFNYFVFGYLILLLFGVIILVQCI